MGVKHKVAYSLTLPVCFHFDVVIAFRVFSWTKFEVSEVHVFVQIAEERQDREGGGGPIYFPVSSDYRPRIK